MSERHPLVTFALLVAAGYVTYVAFTGDVGLCAMAGAFPSNWLQTGSCYVPTLNQIEQQAGLPQNLLCAVAYQESNFNPSAINSSSGAVGMFQLLPQFYPNAGQSWQTDAQSAAQALSDYFNEFGDWQSAIAAYNWGPGNLQKSGADTLAQLPAETSSYITRVSNAVDITGPFVQET
jgi:soluble lytic murein transglycosylase-like protein